MKTSWRDGIAALLAIAGAVVVFAKLNAYSWPLLGSWAGALGVLAVIGLAIMLTNAVELYKVSDGASTLELATWATAAIVVVTSLLMVTTKAQFIWSAALLGLGWVAQMSRHLIRHDHTQGHRPLSVR